MIDEETLAGLRGNAALVIEKLGALRETPLGYDAESVGWVEGYIERMRQRPGQDWEPLVGVLGSYLGEAILDAAGGAWARDPELGLMIRFESGDGCFPFAKVRKQFDRGLEEGESIRGFYEVATGHVAQGRLQNRAPE